MDYFVSNPQIKLAAIHEAGHVIMRHHHGLTTPSVMITPDGTGLTAPGGQLISTVEVGLDVGVGGLVAEDLHSDRDDPPNEDLVIGMLSDLELEPELEEVQDDYLMALAFARAMQPAWSTDDLAKALAAAYCRTRKVLERRWDIVQRLADALIRSPRKVLAENEILQIVR